MIQVGRVQLPGWFETMSREGDTFTFTGILEADTYDEMMHTVASLEATAGNKDEPVVPVLIPEATVAGFYRPQSVDWNFEFFEVDQYRAVWTVVCDRVGNESQPVVVSALQNYQRTNAHSITAPYYFHAVPAAATMHSWLPGETAEENVRPTNPVWAGAGGVRYRRVEGTPAAGQTDARWSCPPESWYQGSCHVETAVGGEWLPVVGRVSLPSSSWRMTNGLVQVTVLAGGTSAGRVRVEWYRDPSVSTAAPYTREFGIRAGSGGDATSWESVEVTRLSPNSVTVRLHAPRTGGATTMYLTLRRGERVVLVTLETPNTSTAHRVRVLSAEAMTAVGTSTLEVTATSGGSKWFMVSAEGVTYDDAAGTAVPNPTSTRIWNVGIGLGTASVGADAGRAAVIDNWLAVQSVIDGFPP